MGYYFQSPSSSKSRTMIPCSVNCDDIAPSKENFPAWIFKECQCLLNEQRTKFFNTFKKSVKILMRLKQLALIYFTQYHTNCKQFSVRTHSKHQISKHTWKLYSCAPIKSPISASNAISEMFLTAEWSLIAYVLSPISQVCKQNVVA